MVVTQGGSGSGEGSGLGSGAASLDDRIQEFISSEITQNILEYTHAIFGSIKEGIMELMDKCLIAFRIEMVAIRDACSLTFREFRACGAHEFLGKKGAIASGRWLADIGNTFSI